MPPPPPPLLFSSVQCCFTSAETVGLLGTGAQDVHLDFHTAPELCPHLSAHPLFALPPAHQLLICLSHISSAHIPLLTASLPPLLSSAHTPLALSPAHYLFTCLSHISSAHTPLALSPAHHLFTCHISVLLTHLLLFHPLTTFSPVCHISVQLTHLFSRLLFLLFFCLITPPLFCHLLTCPSHICSPTSFSSSSV